MKLHSLWTRLVCIFDVLTFSPVDREVPQLPLVQGDSSNVPHELTTIPQDVKAEVSYVEDNGDPVVVTPKNPQEGEAGGLNCSYPGYTGWEPCYGPKNRGCWLRKTDGSETIDIKTDYENPTQVPNGTVRNVRGNEHEIEGDRHTNGVFDSITLNSARSPFLQMARLWSMARYSTEPIRVRG